MNKDFSLLDVLRVLGKWKKHIIISTALVALAAVIGTLLMSNYYKSTTIFYAAHPDLAAPDPIGGSNARKYIYGTDEDLDRLFSMANSVEVKNYLIQKFDLYTHYDVDSTSKKGKSTIMKKFNKLYNTEKTKYDAMALSMEDKDPIIARQIVTAAREKLSDLTQKLVKASQKQTIKGLTETVQKQEKSLSAINDSLITLKSNYGIYDSKTQGEVYAQMLTEATSELGQKEAQLRTMKSLRMPQDSIRKVSTLIAGLKSKTASLSESVQQFNRGILTVKSLEQAQGRIADELSLARERYKKLSTAYDAPFTTLHIVEKETVPVEKSRPKRSIIVIGLTLIAFILSCLAALFIDATKEINWREIFNG